MKPVVWVLALMVASAVGWRVMLCIVRAAEGSSMQLTSAAFADGAAIPAKYTGEGDDLSPPLSWTALPAGAQSLALIVDDPDAPSTQPWVHWVAYNIPADVSALPEGATQNLTPGLNSWPDNNRGYRGPMPPPGGGAHHYHFHLYALDAMLNLEPGADKQALLRAMRGHVLGECELVGTYERKKE